MSNPVGIIGIAGSLRRASYNRAAMRAATQLVPKDASLDVFELDGIPGFNQDAEQNPPGKVVELKKRIRAADAMLIVMPEYNYSIPGALKNVIDWASRPYGDRAGPENRRRSWALRSAPSAQRFVLAASAASTTKHGWPGAQRFGDGRAVGAELAGTLNSKADGYVDRMASECRWRACASTVKQAPVGIGFQRRADVRRYFSFMPRCARTYAWRVICQNLLAARFSGAERHRRRLYKLAALGN